MSNAQIIWDKLILAGITPAGVAALLANLDKESGLRPDNLQNTYEKKLGYTDAGYTAAVDSGTYTNFASDYAGYGLAQWTYPSRKAALLAFARAQGTSIGDMMMQVGYLIQELRRLFPALWRLLCATDSVQEASDAVLLDFERPADRSQANLDRRFALAQEYYDKFGGGESMKPQDRVITLAEAQVGYLYKASNAQLDDFTANPGGKWNKFARDLDALGDFYNGKKNGYDGCDVFVDWLFVQSFGRETGQKMLYQPDRSLGAGTAYSLNYYKQRGRLFTSPEPGDQIFFGDAKSTWHTGLVVAVKDGYVYTIEGNAGSPAAVRACKYALNYQYIKGYGRPDWSLVPEEMEDDEMSEEQIRKIVRDEFAKLEAERAELPASDWAKDELAAVKAKGITDGTRPQSHATRQEVAIMVGRLGKLD